MHPGTPQRTVLSATPHYTHSCTLRVICLSREHHEGAHSPPREWEGGVYLPWVLEEGGASTEMWGGSGGRGSGGQRLRYEQQLEEQTNLFSGGMKRRKEILSQGGRGRL